MNQSPDATAATATVSPADGIILDVSRCPSCPNSVWNDAGQCPTCGLEKDTVIQRLRFGSTCYEEARNAALSGDYLAARALLQEARTAGFDHPVVQRLDALCVVAVGDSLRQNQREQLPPDWQEVADASDWKALYESARQDAAAGQWELALAKTDSVTASAPWFLPAQKLCLLCRAGSGQSTEAEAARQQLLQKFPADADLQRYHFPLPPPPVIPPSQNTSWRIRLAYAGYATALLWAFAAGTQFANVRQQPAAVPATTSAHQLSPTPAPPLVAASSAPAKPLPLASPGITLAPALQAEQEKSQAQTDLNLARRWFNRAVVARGQNRFGAARELAQAAYRLAPDSYLAADALLLQAQASEKEGDAAAAETSYGKLAEQFPMSPYAPLALVQAARAARLQGSFLRASSYNDTLQRRYKASPEAIRLHRLTSSTRKP